MSYQRTLALATAGFGLTDAHRPLVTNLIEAGTLAVLTGIDLEPRDRFFLELRAQLHSDDASQNFPRLAAFHHGNRRRLQTSVIRGTYRQPSTGLRPERDPANLSAESLTRAAQNARSVTR